MDFNVRRRWATTCCPYRNLRSIPGWFLVIWRFSSYFFIFIGIHKFTWILWISCLVVSNSFHYIFQIFISFLQIYFYMFMLFVDFHGFGAWMFAASKEHLAALIETSARFQAGFLSSDGFHEFFKILINICRLNYFCRFSSILGMDVCRR